MAQAPTMVWIDMEMSGLEVERERILEIAVLLTDDDLEVVAEGPELVLHQPEAVLAAMDEWNQRHHGESGLVERVRASQLREAEAEREVLDFLKRHVPAAEAPLAGNSVHQDRAFLRRYMPRLHAHLHYRNVDVSTLKELVGRWYPEVARRAPAKKKAHRALEDIRESIDELRYYRRAVFHPGG